MTGTESVMEDGGKRSRTSSRKTERRKAILEAADSHLRTAGFEQFSMGKLAKEVGIARATLYLYFGTREEVLVSLHTQQVTAWSEALLQTVHEGMDDETFLQSYLATALRDPLLLELSARLGNVIEQNISVESLIVSKRSLHTILTRLAEHFCRTLHLHPEGAMRLVISLGALLLGASQIDAGPSIDPEVMPTDIAGMIKAVAVEDVFLGTARLILSGIRMAG